MKAGFNTAQPVTRANRNLGRLSQRRPATTASTRPRPSCRAGTSSPLLLGLQTIQQHLSTGSLARSGSAERACHLWQGDAVQDSAAVAGEEGGEVAPVLVIFEAGQEEGLPREDLGYAAAGSAAQQRLWGGLRTASTPGGVPSCWRRAAAHITGCSSGGEALQRDTLLRIHPPARMCSARAGWEEH